jgi:LytS/YehU family sensor histidine kinase
MADSIATLTSIFTLFGTASFMIVVALVVSGFKFFKPSAAKNKTLAKVAIGVVLGLLAVFGTLMGSKMADGTIINVRELSVMIAGVAGGPIGGVVAGVIGGVHRYTVGGATAVPCTVSTILIGAISGLVSMKLAGKMYLLKGVILGLGLESTAMALILALVPFSQAVTIVGKIAVPMISANTVGLVLWMYLANKWKQPENPINSNTEKTAKNPQEAYLT